MRLPDGVHAEPSWRRVPDGWTVCAADVFARDRVSYRLPELWVRFSQGDVEWERVPPAVRHAQPWVEIGRTADGRVMGVRIVGLDRG